MSMPFLLFPPEPEVAVVNPPGSDAASTTGGSTRRDDKSADLNGTAPPQLSFFERPAVESPSSVGHVFQAAEDFTSGAHGIAGTHHASPAQDLAVAHGDGGSAGGDACNSSEESFASMALQEVQLAQLCTEDHRACKGHERGGMHKFRAGGAARATHAPATRQPPVPKLKLGGTADAESGTPDAAVIPEIAPEENELMRALRRRKCQVEGLQPQNGSSAISEKEGCHAVGFLSTSMAANKVESPGGTPTIAKAASPCRRRSFGLSPRPEAGDDFCTLSLPSAREDCPRKMVSDAVEALATSGDVPELTAVVRACANLAERLKAATSGERDGTAMAAVAAEAAAALEADLDTGVMTTPLKRTVVPMRPGKAAAAAARAARELLSEVEAAFERGAQDVSGEAHLDAGSSLLDMAAASSVLDMGTPQWFDLSTPRIMEKEEVHIERDLNSPRSPESQCPVLALPACSMLLAAEPLAEWADELRSFDPSSALAPQVSVTPQSSPRDVPGRGVRRTSFSWTADGRPPLPWPSPPMVE